MSAYIDLARALSDRALALAALDRAQRDLAQAEARIGALFEALELPIAQEVPHGLVPLVVPPWIVRAGPDGKPLVERCVTLSELQLRDEAAEATAS